MTTQSSRRQQYMVDIVITMHNIYLMSTRIRLWPMPCIIQFMSNVFRTLNLFSWCWNFWKLKITIHSERQKIISRVLNANSNICFALPQLISSGAFEISINDIPVWSKLETGRIPSPQELFQIIDSHINVFSTATVQNFDQ